MVVFQEKGVSRKNFGSVERIDIPVIMLMRGNQAVMPNIA
jgi:hypothetical protein